MPAESCKHGASMVRFFFDDNFPFDEAARQKVFKKGDPLARLAELESFMGNIEDFSHDSIYAAIAAEAEKRGLKTTEYFPILRYAVSGMAGGPDLMPALEILGKERVMKRIRAFPRS